ncbi:Alpha/beta hydrolase family-domain-containing protein [Infundibulicybe gibba]|nr:Alpha/beta hydrolase family-domain-containing protein [Infundibulicybe gibba]
MPTLPHRLALLFLSLSSPLLAARGHSVRASPLAYNCTQTTIPISVSTQTLDLPLREPQSQLELTGTITQIVSTTSNVTAAAATGLISVNATYQIYSELCIPARFAPGGVLEFAIHGVRYDHTYWNFGGPGSKYNYVEAAINSGHAIFIYDRLGVGKSSKPDGVREVQRATEVQIAARLLEHLRSNTPGVTFGKVVGIGHSFGSSQIIGVVDQFGGDLFDAVVLTGFSPFGGGLASTIAAFGFSIAREKDPVHFAGLPSSYIASEGMPNDQLIFFHFPAFEPEALELSSQTPGTATLGELLTQAAPPATGYHNPALVVTGDKDFIFCGGNCFQPLNGSANMVAATRDLVPNAREFDIYIPAETGHAVNMHLSTPSTYGVIQDWIKRQL